MILNKNRPKKSWSQKGDTIIEVLIAMSILAVILAAAYATSTRSLQRGINFSIRSQAIAIGQQQLEIIKDVAQHDATQLDNFHHPRFCIKPSDQSVTNLPGNGECNLTGTLADGTEDMTMYITYEPDVAQPGALTYTVNVRWPTPGTGDFSQATFKYKTQDSLVNTPGATTINEGGPSNAHSSGVQITTTPTDVLSGGRTSLNWNTTYGIATTCAAVDPTPNVGGWSGPKPTSGGPVQTSTLTEDTTYGITCNRPAGGGTDTSSVTVNVDKINTFAADNPTLDYGGSTTLRWSAQHMSSCSIDGGAAKGANDFQDTGSLLAGRTYTLTCTGKAGTDTQTLRVDVNGAPKVTSFTPDQGKTAGTPIAFGDRTTIRWTSVNTVSCYLPDVFPFTFSGQSGNFDTGSLRSTTGYRISCVNGAGVWSDDWISSNTYTTTSVFVNTAPTATITASPANVVYGATTTVNWSSVNTVSCSSPQFGGGLPPTGSRTVGPLTANPANYTVNCVNSVGSSTGNKSVSITVGPVPTVSVTASPPNPQFGGSTTISWSSNIPGMYCESPDIYPYNSIGSSGSVVVSGVSSNLVYRVRCFNGAVWTNGGAYSQATVTVAPAPTASISVSPSVINYGQSAILSWSGGGGATNCTTSIGYGGLSGSVAVAPGPGSTPYSVTCFNGAGAAASASTSLWVNQPLATIYECGNVGMDCFGAFSGPAANVAQGQGYGGNPLGSIHIGSLLFNSSAFTVTLYGDNGVCENFYHNSAGMNDATSPPIDGVTPKGKIYTSLIYAVRGDGPQPNCSNQQ